MKEKTVRIVKTTKGESGHEWFKTWERTGQSHAGEWFDECINCGAWHQGTPTEKTCEEVSQMSRDEVVRTGG